MRAKNVRGRLVAQASVASVRPETKHERALKATVHPGRRATYVARGAEAPCA